jgi:hypothetical protein
MERCYICRKFIPEGQVYRRTIPVAMSRGGFVGRGMDVGQSVTYAPRSLCWSCHEDADIRSQPGWGSFFFLTLLGMWIFGSLGSWLWNPQFGMVAQWVWAIVVSVGFYQERKDLRRRKRQWQAEQQRSGPISLGKRSTPPKIGVRA